MIGSTRLPDNCESPWDSRRLWSLWEMYELKAGDFLRTSIALGVLHRIAQEGEKETAARDLNYGERATVQESVEALIPHVEMLGAIVTAMAIDDFVTRVAGRSTVTTKCDWGFVRERVAEISRTIQRELSTQTVLALTSREREFFKSGDRLFGDEVSGKFTTEGAFEIDEAAKCYSLGRPTAAVFHLMRTMEIGIR